jgi:hypothetical protein
MRRQIRLCPISTTNHAELTTFAMQTRGRRAASAIRASSGTWSLRVARVQTFLGHFGITGQCACSVVMRSAMPEHLGRHRQYRKSPSGGRGHDRSSTRASGFRGCPICTRCSLVFWQRWQLRGAGWWTSNARVVCSMERQGESAASQLHFVGAVHPGYRVDGSYASTS